MKNIQTYEPRHAGGVAAVRSRRRRAQVDIDRAMRLLDAQIEAGNLEAMRLALKLHLPAARALVSA